jgi:hypothetical protein
VLAAGDSRRCLQSLAKLVAVVGRQMAQRGIMPEVQRLYERVLCGLGVEQVELPTWCSAQLLHTLLQDAVVSSNLYVAWCARAERGRRGAGGALERQLLRGV